LKIINQSITGTQVVVIVQILEFAVDCLLTRKLKRIQILSSKITRSTSELAWISIIPSFMPFFRSQNETRQDSLVFAIVLKNKTKIGW